VAHFAVPELLHRIWYMVKKITSNPMKFTTFFILTESQKREVAASLVIRISLIRGLYDGIFNKKTGKTPSG